MGQDLAVTPAPSPGAPRVSAVSANVGQFLAYTANPSQCNSTNPLHEEEEEETEDELPDVVDLAQKRHQI